MTHGWSASRRRSTFSSRRARSIYAPTKMRLRLQYTIELRGATSDGPHSSTIRSNARKNATAPGSFPSRYASTLSRSAISGQLLLDQLADHRAVGAAGHLVHDTGHHAAEVADAGGADLRDDVVDDLLDLLLGERLGHELLEHIELELLVLRLLFATARPERLGRLDAPFALA